MEAYEQLNLLGSGSFGHVYRIRRKADSKIMVWKEMNYGVMSEREKAMLVTEVNILRELKHQNIVRYYDRIINRDTSKIYIVMEFCENGDLAGLLKQHKRSGKYMEESKIWNIFFQIVLAIHECHTRSGKILHRDIKPANIFIDKNNVVKLGDFGLARVLGEKSLAYTNVGTPFYMSPEQVREMAYNDKSDMWSLGCLLHEMCALSPPFEAANQLALAVKIRAGKYMRIPSQYSEELQRTIDSLLRVDPEKRVGIDGLLKQPEIALRMRERRTASQVRQLRTYEDDLKARETSVADREKALAEKEKSLADREKAVAEREKSVLEKEKSLFDLERRLRRASAGETVAAAAGPLPVGVAGEKETIGLVRIPSTTTTTTTTAATTTFSLLTAAIGGGGGGGRKSEEGGIPTVGLERVNPFAAVRLSAPAELISQQLKEKQQQQENLPPPPPITAWTLPTSLSDEQPATTAAQDKQALNNNNNNSDEAVNKNERNERIPGPDDSLLIVKPSITNAPKKKVLRRMSTENMRPLMDLNGGASVVPMDDADIAIRKRGGATDYTSAAALALGDENTAPLWKDRR